MKSKIWILITVVSLCIGVSVGLLISELRRERALLEVGIGELYSSILEKVGTLNQLRRDNPDKVIMFKEKELESDLHALALTQDVSLISTNQAKILRLAIKYHSSYPLQVRDANLSNFLKRINPIVRSVNSSQVGPVGTNTLPIR